MSIFMDGSMLAGMVFGEEHYRELSINSKFRRLSNESGYH